MSYEKKYKIAINRMSTGKLAGGDPRWGRFNDSFENRECSILELANAIYLGHAYTGWHTGRRANDNFICAQHIALDFDDNDSIDDLLSIDFIRAYASILHSTPSHTEESPRSRAVFFLDKPIHDSQRYSNAVSFLIRVFGSDESCKDAARFFFGAHDCELELIGRELPLSHLRALYARLGKPAVESGIEVVNWPTHIENPSDDGSDSNAKDLIAQFNAANRVESMLARYGYTKCNNRTWSRPGKKDSAGVYIDHEKNKTYNHSSNDALFNGRNGGKQPADSFDYYCHYEHGGDIRAALAAVEMEAKIDK